MGFFTGCSADNLVDELFFRELGIEVSSIRNLVTENSLFLIKVIEILKVT